MNFEKDTIYLLYDILYDALKLRDPNNKIIKSIGAPVNINMVDNAVKLPYWMGSMDKIKPDDKKFMKWKQKFIGPYIFT